MSKDKPLRQRKRLARRLAKLLLCCACCLVLLTTAYELIYRWQVVDTYAHELKANNDEAQLNAPAGGKTILVLGDSFSVTLSNYPSLIRESQDEYRVINGAIGGSGIVQANVIAGRRFERFAPSIFIYQIYVGNDLFDLRYPVNWKALSVVRNVYWSAARWLRSLVFLNYRLGQLVHDFRHTPDSDKGWIEYNKEFSPERYSPRDKIHILAEPGGLQDAVLVQGDRQADYKDQLRRLEQLLSHCDPQTCQAYLLIIPHCAQVHRRYLERMQGLGMLINEPERILADEFPFVTGIRELLNASGLDFVEVLNATPILRDHEDRGKPVYYQNDGHLNPYGQSVIAEFVQMRIGIQDPSPDGERDQG